MKTAYILAGFRYNMCTVLGVYSSKNKALEAREVWAPGWNPLHDSYDSSGNLDTAYDFYNILEYRVNEPACNGH